MSTRRIRRAHDGVLGRVRGRSWVALAEHLRADAADRAHYDRATAVMRALEQRDIAGSELDIVEHWLEQAGVIAAAHAPAPRTRWAWIGLAFALAAAAVLALRTVPPGPGDDELRVKGGGYARPLGLQLLCDDGHAAAPALRDAAVDGCPLDATLSFAIRVDDGYAGGTAASVFGIDDRGEVLYYQPVPDGHERATLVHGRWQPLGRAVRLSVNHRPGRVRVFAVLTPSAPSIAAIDEAAAALAAMPAAGLEVAPWHERLAGHVSLLAACTAPGQCASAELELQIVDVDDAGQGVPPGRDQP